MWDSAPNSLFWWLEPYDHSGTTCCFGREGAIVVVHHEIDTAIIIVSVVPCRRERQAG
ncbi:unnamed protein product [Periconia digitata]|uniref:Uncharacterized protein n=1 Tax=Periconia digitata TaxID=1303443 RepID=A0A9W4XSX3_9PLEO|nr:unnamed protein product [Periconia digitata]